MPEQIQEAAEERGEECRFLHTPRRCGGVSLLWYSVNSSRKGWKQRAPWHRTGGISALGFPLFVLTAKICRVGWRKSDGDEAQGAGCHSSVPSLLNRKLERTCWKQDSAPQWALLDMTPVPGQN